ncbi:hypothetical protein MBANPS3_011517 [Mucor bainieri]
MLDKDDALEESISLSAKAIKADTAISVTTAKTLIAKVAPTFMECVILIEDHWFLIAGYSVFLHDPSRLDDCADKSHFQYQSNPVASIERKTAFGKESFELSIKVGYLELLANAGFFGATDSTDLTPFSGLALRNLPTRIIENYHASTSKIFIKETPSYSSRNRIINQYYKEMAKVSWQLDSRKFNQEPLARGRLFRFAVKNKWKLEHYKEQRENVTFKNVLSHRVPSHANQLFQSSEYALLDAKRFSNVNLPTTIAQAEKMVSEVFAIFMECVCIIQDHWFLVTSHSVFLHGQHYQLDDCADKSHHQFKGTAKASINRKTAYGRESFELSIKVGCMELLANGGFFGSTTGSLDMMPFVGSAIQNLPLEIASNYKAAVATDIFIKQKPASYGKRNKIINQYYKDSATLKWQLDSRKFSDVSVCNPIMLSTKEP